MRVVEAGVDKLTMDDTFCEWLRSLGVTPERCYRAVIDGDELTALCYAEDTEGRKYVVKDPKLLHYGEAAVKEPVTVKFDPCAIPDARWLG